MLLCFYAFILLSFRVGLLVIPYFCPIFGILRLIMLVCYFQNGFVENYPLSSVTSGLLHDQFYCITEYSAYLEYLEYLDYLESSDIGVIYCD